MGLRVPRLFSPGRQRALSFKWASWISARLGISSMVSTKTTSECPACSINSTALEGRKEVRNKGRGLLRIPSPWVSSRPSPDVFFVRVTGYIEPCTSEKVTASRVVPGQALQMGEKRVIVKELHLSYLCPHNDLTASPPIPCPLTL